MAWALLVAAGMLEVGWAALLPATNGLRSWQPTVGFVVLLVASMTLLSIATRTVPSGSAGHVSPVYLTDSSSISPRTPSSDAVASPLISA